MLILVVEDEPLVAKALVRTLRMIGLSSMHVQEAKTALDAVRDVKPDLVLLDIGLAGSLDGIELGKEIRKICEMPIVFLTGFADQRTLDRAKAVEPEGYLVKPFQSDELRSTIEIARSNFDRRMERARTEEKFLERVQHIVDEYRKK